MINNDKTITNDKQLHMPEALFSEGAFSKLISQLQQAINAKGYLKPSPVQQESIPVLLDGRDVLGSAQTGTGKTAAFVLPILQRLALQKKNSLPGKPRVLIVAPTRELASQIGESIGTYGRHLDITWTVIFGGVKQHSQVEKLKIGKHIVVATPGRLLDLINQGLISLEYVETFVLDEADRMLDMGFLPDIRKIIAALPEKRQTIFFSATLPEEIVKLTQHLLKNPVKIAVTPEVTAVEEIQQKIYFVDKINKPKLLVNLLNDDHMSKVIVFTGMKHLADRLARILNKEGIQADVIHSDKSQNARTRSLDNFKCERVRVLIATDIAARGLDVYNISHVINYDLPNLPETYVHRIGRTARAGTKGDAVSFCSAEERNRLNMIEKFIGEKIAVIEEHQYHSDNARFATGSAARPAPKKQSVRFQAARDRARLSKPISYSKGKKGSKKPENGKNSRVKCKKR